MRRVNLAVMRTPDKKGNLVHGVRRENKGGASLFFAAHTVRRREEWPRRSLFPAFWKIDVFGRCPSVVQVGRVRLSRYSRPCHLRENANLSVLPRERVGG